MLSSSSSWSESSISSLIITICGGKGAVSVTSFELSLVPRTLFEIFDSAEWAAT